MPQSEYNIHDLLRLRISGTVPLLAEVDLHLRQFKAPPTDSAPDIIVRPFSESTASAGEVCMDDLEFSDGEFRREATRSAFRPFASPQVYQMDRLSWPINLIVQLGLLRKASTFVHASAVEYEGIGILFPAYPGTGKTTTATSLVRAGGRFLADDLTILDGNSLRSYRQALSVYPHHLSVLDYHNAAIERGFRRADRARRLQSRLDGSGKLPRLASRALGLVGTSCANVMPSDVFAPESLGDSIELGMVATLERSLSVSTLTVKPIEKAELAGRSSAVLWHEWHNSVHELLLLDAVFESGEWLNTLVNQVRVILERNWSGVPLYRIQIPNRWGNDQLTAEFPQLVKDLVSALPETGPLGTSS